MRFLFSFLVVVLTLAFVITAIIYFIGRAFKDLRLSTSSHAAFRDVLEQMRQQVKTLMADLTPWDAEMFSLLSLNRQPVRGKGNFRKFSSGYLLSIFQEPVVAFAIAESDKHQKVALARLHDREFVFRKKGNDVEIWLNGEPMGIFSNGTLLSSDKTARLLAHLEEKPSEHHSELQLANGRTVNLTNREQTTSPNPRAAVLVRELNRDEENIALALALMRLLV